MSSRLGFVTVVVAAALAGACSKSKPKDGEAAKAGPADPRVAGIIATSKELRDRACACTDASCAAAVRHEHDAWLRAQIDEYAKQGEPTSTKAQEQEAAALQKALFECLDKPHAQAPPAPSATPPATP